MLGLLENCTFRLVEACGFKEIGSKIGLEKEIMEVKNKELTKW